MSFKILPRLLVMGLAIFLALGAGSAMAAKDGEKVRLIGTVSAIDLNGENFTISDRQQNSTKIFVNPTTEFEIEKGKDFFGDDDIPFKDLKVGDWVKIESHRVNGEFEASEVDIYRTR